MTVCGLRFTSAARARIIKAGGETITFDQLALRAPKGQNTLLLQGPRKAREAEKVFPIIIWFSNQTFSTLDRLPVFLVAMQSPWSAPKVFNSITIKKIILSNSRPKVREGTWTTQVPWIQELRRRWFEHRQSLFCYCYMRKSYGQ